MSENISCKINVSKINKDRLFKGAKGTYLDCVLIPSSNDQFGNDFMIIQGVTKEERLAGKKGEIIGNAKFFGQPSQPRKPITTAPNTPARNAESNPVDDGSDVPF